VPCLQRLDGMEHERDSRFHVENAGAAQASVFDFAGHLRQRAEWIDRVVVPQDQNGLARGVGREVDLQTIAELAGAMELRLPTKRFKFRREKLPDAVDRRFIVAGGLDFHEFANRLNHQLPTLFEVAQAGVPIDLRRSAGCGGYIFLRWHKYLSMEKAVAALSS
jgi:hypothetical protein